MSKKILIYGFGRMGISHSVILSGLLGATECEFFVVERSKVAQVLARSLLKQCVILPESKVKDFQFDYALVCTPPFVRDAVLEVINASYIFVEKPVLCYLAENMMSGYVMQHLPLFDHMVPHMPNPAEVHSISVEVISNVDFTSQLGGWRANDCRGISNEFFGHAVTFALTPLVRAYNQEFLKDGKILRYNVNDPNQFSLVFESGTGLLINVSLSGANDVRKTTYVADYKCGDRRLEFTPYGAMFCEDGIEVKNINIAAAGVNCSFYVRGFEFTNQMARLLSHDFDIVSRSDLNAMERFLDECYET